MPGILAKKTKSKKEEIVNMARMHKHPHYEIYYLARGDRNYYINNEKYTTYENNFKKCTL